MPDRIRPLGPPKQPTVEDLLRQHKSLADIPDSALEAIGYVRTEDGSRILPKSRLGVIEQEKRQKKEALERKKENLPFETLPVEVSADKMGRYADFSEINGMCENLRSLDDDVSLEAETCIKEIDGDGSPLLALLQELKEPYTLEHIGDVKVDERDKFLGDLFYDRVRALITEAVTEFEKNVDPHRIQEKHTNKFEDDDFEKWPGEASMELYEELERSRGKLADPDFYGKLYWEKMTQIQLQGDFFYPIEMTDETYKAIGNNIFDISKRLFARVLGRHELESHAAKLMEAGEITRALDAVRDRVMMSDAERKLRERIKNAPNEEKRSLSGELKSIKNERELNQRLLSGIEAFYRGPEAVAQYLSREIKSVQRQLTHGSESGQKKTFLLDARPNDILDRNPGVVSGDCTDGRSLPFENPALSLYNVKVFDSANAHIGNIYLLSTEKKYGKDKGQKVWHLDAIQIPAALDWDVAIQNLFATLENAAKSKDISMISVNTELATISNYDYIAKAVDAYLKNAGRRVMRTEIEIPRVGDERHADLQGNGQVFAILVGSKREGE